MRYLIVSALAALAFAATPVAQAETTALVDSGSVIHYANSAAAHDAGSGIPSFEITPGTTVNFEYPDNSGTGYVDVSMGSAKPAKAVFATFFDGWFNITFHQNYAPGLSWVAFTWQHYFSWSGNGTCVVSRYSNSAYSLEQHHGWDFQGNTAYVVNHIDHCNDWFNGRQGKYCWFSGSPGPCGGALRIKLPWQVAEAYAWGTWRTYDWGDPDG